MNLNPILQIRQTPGIIGIDADRGQYSIQQPRADMDLSTQPAQLEIHQYQPKLKIDQSAAIAAYNGGSVIEMNKRIYSGNEQVFLQNMANRVKQGNDLAAIHISGNTFANIVGTDTGSIPLPEFRGPASVDNVDVDFEIRALETSYQPAAVNLNVQVNRPAVEYTRGKLDIYMQQHPSVQFTPPEVDMKM
ncbi:MAG TPA: DUF6470 family protein [Paenibacillus sp.]